MTGKSICVHNFRRLKAKRFHPYFSTIVTSETFLVFNQKKCFYVHRRKFPLCLVYNLPRLFEQADRHRCSRRVGLMRSWPLVFVLVELAVTNLLAPCDSFFNIRDQIFNIHRFTYVVCFFLEHHHMDYLHPLPHVVGPFPRRWPSACLPEHAPAPGSGPSACLALVRAMQCQIVPPGEWSKLCSK